MSDDRCEIRTTSSGQNVRVRGSISQERLDQLGDWVQRYADSRCGEESTKAMPAIAQRAHGRDHYACGREKGHDGLHRWPDRDDGEAIVEW